jgi:SAM-dependent methyltransferase
MRDGKQGVEVEDLVFSLYKAMLDRDPDPAGLSYYVELIRQGASLQSIIQEFLTSPERGYVVSLGQLDALPHNIIDLNLSSNEKELLWEHVARSWSRLGREDPWWSVISNDQFRNANMQRPELIADFYESGRLDIERASKYLGRHERAFPEGGVCIDFGCGVGRGTLWLARRCRQILAVDVSEPHLALARNNLSTRGIRNVEFRLLSSRTDLQVLEGVDCFYSTIALQHNPPPLIVDILSAALGGLNSGGSAFFQIPTYAVKYSWNYKDYISAISFGHGFEMHLLPQPVIFKLAAEGGCIPLEVQPDQWVGNKQWISNTFLFGKP